MIPVFTSKASAALVWEVFQVDNKSMVALLIKAGAAAAEGFPVSRAPH